MKSKFSTKFCEKLLKEIQDQHRSTGADVSLECLLQMFPKHSIEDIKTALYYLEDEGCITNLQSRSDIPGLSRWDIELNYHGKTYLVLKREHQRELWVNRILSYIAGVSTPIIVFLITEYLLP